MFKQERERVIMREESETVVGIQQDWLKTATKINKAGRQIEHVCNINLLKNLAKTKENNRPFWEIGLTFCCLES